MKGKLNLRFFAPNVAKVRTRMKEVPADFTPTLRAVLAEAAAEVIEKNQIDFKAAVIAKVAEAYPDVEFTSAANRNAVESVLQDFYAIFVSPTKEEFDKRFGPAASGDDDDPIDVLEEPEVPSETPTPKIKKTNKAKKEAKAVEAEESEFDD